MNFTKHDSVVSCVRMMSIAAPHVASNKGPFGTRYFHRIFKRIGILQEIFSFVIFAM
jgi:hypothetical protein